MAGDAIAIAQKEHDRPARSFIPIEPHASIQLGTAPVQLGRGRRLRKSTIKALRLERIVPRHRRLNSNFLSSPTSPLWGGRSAKRFGWGDRPIHLRCSPTRKILRIFRPHHKGKVGQCSMLSIKRVLPIFAAARMRFGPSLAGPSFAASRMVT